MPTPSIHGYTGKIYFYQIISIGHRACIMADANGKFPLAFSADHEVIGCTEVSVELKDISRRIELEALMAEKKSVESALENINGMLLAHEEKGQ